MQHMNKVACAAIQQHYARTTPLLLSAVMHCPCLQRQKSQAAMQRRPYLHGAVVGSCDTSRTAFKHNTLVGRSAQLDGGRQEPLADGVHAVLCCDVCLKELTQTQSFQQAVHCLPAIQTCCDLHADRCPEYCMLRCVCMHKHCWKSFAHNSKECMLQLA